MFSFFSFFSPPKSSPLTAPRNQKLFVFCINHSPACDVSHHKSRNQGVTNAFTPTNNNNVATVVYLLSVFFFFECKESHSTTFSKNRRRQRTRRRSGTVAVTAALRGADRNNNTENKSNNNNVIQIEQKQQNDSNLKPLSIDTLQSEALGQLSSSSSSTTELTGKKFVVSSRCLRTRKQTHEVSSLNIAETLTTPCKRRILSEESSSCSLVKFKNVLDTLLRARMLKARIQSETIRRGRKKKFSNIIGENTFI